MHIFGEIPYQATKQHINNTELNGLKTMQNEKETYLFLVDLLSLVGRLYLASIF